MALVLASRRTGVTRYLALGSSDFPHAAGLPRPRRGHPAASLTGRAGTASRARAEPPTAERRRRRRTPPAIDAGSIGLVGDRTASDAGPTGLGAVERHVHSASRTSRPSDVLAASVEAAQGLAAPSRA